MKIIKVLLVVVSILVFSSGACDPSPRNMTFTIINQSDKEIVFCNYLFPKDMEIGSILKTIKQDINSFTVNGPQYPVLKSNEEFIINTRSSRQSIIEQDDSANVVIWIVESQRINELNNFEKIDLKQLDYLYIGGGKEIDKMDWKIVYQSKPEYQ